MHSTAQHEDRKHAYTFYGNGIKIQTQVSEVHKGVWKETYSSENWRKCALPDTGAQF